MPKIKVDSYGILQKNHRLRYLYYDGKIRDNENIRIFQKGFFLAPRGLLSRKPYGFVKITIGDKNIQITDMWKRTDFKIALNEIRLYEVADENRSQWEKQMATIDSETEIKNLQSMKANSKTINAVTHPPDQNLSKDEEVESEVLAMLNIVRLTGLSAPGNLPAANLVKEEKRPSEILVTELDLPSAENHEKPVAVEEQTPKPGAETGAEVVKEQAVPEQLRTLSEPKRENFLEEKIEFVPIQEMVLDADGKAAEEYKSNK